MCLCIYVYLCVFMCIYVYLCVYMCIYVYICVFMCIYVCVFMSFLLFFKVFFYSLQVCKITTNGVNDFGKKMSQSLPSMYVYLKRNIIHNNYYKN